ncbi:MAG: hypothetical protein NTX27_08835, partial [Verrucomicrobia bacterium]|nr:hypothetical protein [Verrucomicrobiota bacterium]
MMKTIQSPLQRHFIDGQLKAVGQSACGTFDTDGGGQSTRRWGWLPKSIRFLAILVTVLFPHCAAWAQAQYAGTYVGSYSGGESGTWVGTVTSSGSATGYYVDPFGGMYYGAGTVSQTGGWLMGFANPDATFKAQIDGRGHLAGTWTNPPYGFSGNFSGSRTTAPPVTVISLQVVGRGTVGGATNGQPLELGKTVTLTATPATGYALTNWLVQVGGVTVLSTNKVMPFTMQPGLAVTATFVDVQKPVLSLTTPTSGQRWSNALFSVSGKVSDNGPGGVVWYQLNGGAWGSATGWSNWSANVTLNPGTNLISAYAQDTAGNRSPTNSAVCTYVLTAPITVTVIGNGTVGGVTNGQRLELGKTVTLTATPGTGYALTNWLVQVGGVTVLSTNKVTPFAMQSNLVLTATFVDVQKPVLSLATPTSGQRWSNALFSVTGKVTDNGPGGVVWYQLNGGAWGSATGWSNWSANVTLNPGTNLISAYAQDT